MKKTVLTSSMDWFVPYLGGIEIPVTSVTTNL